MMQFFCNKKLDSLVHVRLLVEEINCRTVDQLARSETAGAILLLDYQSQS